MAKIYDEEEEFDDVEIIDESFVEDLSEEEEETSGGSVSGSYGTLSKSTYGQTIRFTAGMGKTISSFKLTRNDCNATFIKDGTGCFTIKRKAGKIGQVRGTVYYKNQRFHEFIALFK